MAADLGERLNWLVSAAPPISFRGLIWRYDLEATGPSRTTLMLTYD